MGISRLKRLITEDLYRAFNLSDFKHFCWELEPNLDLNKLTGFPENIAVPIKNAANDAVEYFFKTKKIAPLLNLIVNTAEDGFKGEKKVFNNFKKIMFELKECGYRYNRELEKIVIKDELDKRSDWGYLQEAQVYNFCFASIDICSNSKFFQKYDTASIRKTYQNFKNLIKSIVEKRDGRIWNWEGDGGIASFHINNFVNQTVLASIDILSALPIFNSTSNYIDEDIIIRIGINSGSTEYKNDTQMINSEVINKTKNIEKNSTYPMTISVTPHTFQHIDPIMKKYFTFETICCEPVYNLKLPMLGVKFDS